MHVRTFHAFPPRSRNMAGRNVGITRQLDDARKCFHCVFDYRVLWLNVADQGVREMRKQTTTYQRLRPLYSSQTLEPTVLLFFQQLFHKKRPYFTMCTQNKRVLRRIFHNDYKTDPRAKSTWNIDYTSASRVRLKSEALTLRYGVSYKDETACLYDFAGGACKA